MPINPEKKRFNLPYKVFPIQIDFGNDRHFRALSFVQNRQISWCIVTGNMEVEQNFGKLQGFFLNTVSFQNRDWELKDLCLFDLFFFRIVKSMNYVISTLCNPTEKPEKYVVAKENQI